MKRRHALSHGTAWAMAGTLALAAACAPGPDGNGPDAGDTTCATPLEGTDPFAAVLAGAVSYVVDGEDAPVEGHMDIQAYFPDGRRPGAKVILAGPASYYGDLGLSEYILDADAGVPELGWSGKDGLQDVWFEGRLVGPAGGIVGTAHRNFAEPLAHTPWGEGPVVMCPGGAPPEPELRAEGSVVPTSSLSFIATAPIDPASVTATAQAGGVDVPVTVTVRTAGGADRAGESVHLAPTDAFPPNAEVTVSLEATDVIGRPFTLRATPETLRTSAVVTDLTFTEALPQGACAADGAASCWVTDGVLQLADGLSSASFAALVALPEPGAATGLRADVLLGAWCDTGVQLHLVDAAGQVASGVYPEGAEGEAQAVAFEVPAGRPLWLVVQHQGHHHEPQWDPPAPCTFAIDALTFE